MLNAIFIHYGYDYYGDTVVKGTVIEVDSENDEFIAWYTDNKKCENVFIVHGPVKVPDEYKSQMAYSSKTIELTPF